MRRASKYPDTDTFTYHNANPKNRITGDCVYRAIAKALDIDWKEVVLELAKLACETGQSPASDKNFGLFLERHGFTKCKQPKQPSGKKFTGAEFVRCHNETIVMNIGSHHVSCAVGGKIHDIWDCSHKCVGVYWIKL